MPYEKTIWKNREVERPRTFEKIENPDGTITLVPAEGNIIEPGTPIIAENMNKIEQGIEDSHNAIDAHKADYEQHTPYAIATGTNSYAVNIDGVTSLVEGMSVKVKFTSANTGACTLNINGLGAKEIRKSNGNSLSAGNIKAGQILHLVYTGSVFQLLGEGGEYGNVTPDDVIKGVTFGTEEGLKTGTLELTGNATASQVLTGRTFYTTNPKSKQTGTMPNRGAVTNTITTQGGSYTIPAGYHNGSGKVTANFANLVPENIKQGVNIGGVVGTVPVIKESGVFSMTIPGETGTTTYNIPVVLRSGDVLVVYSMNNHGASTGRSPSNMIAGIRYVINDNNTSTAYTGYFTTWNNQDSTYYFRLSLSRESSYVRLSVNRLRASQWDTTYHFTWVVFSHIN